MEHGFMSNLIKKSWMDSFTHSCALWFGGFTKVLLIHSYSVMSLISNSLNVLSFQWLPILVSFNHLLITVNCSFNFLFYLSYCRGNRGSKSKWKWIPNWEFWFFKNSGPPECQKNSGGVQKKIKNQLQLSSNQESPLSAFSDGHFSSRHQSITLREAKISRCMSWGKLLLCLMCLKLRGFQIDDCVFQRHLKFDQVVLPIYHSELEWNFCVGFS